MKTKVNLEKITRKLIPKYKPKELKQYNPQTFIERYYQTEGICYGGKRG